MINRFLAAIVVMITAGQAEAETPTAKTAFILEPEHLAVVKEAVAARLLDPESAILSDVIAATESGFEGGAMVCGYVRGKNSMGGYSQPTMFIGGLLPGQGESMSFLVISIARPDPADQSRVADACVDALN